jgi:hypothetical protein
MCNNKNIVEEMREYNGTFIFNAEDIIDCIEREFIPRPQFKNGEYVRIGDKFYYNGYEWCVTSMQYDKSGWRIFSEDGYVFEPCDCKYVEPDTIKKVWWDAEVLESVLTCEPGKPGAVTSLLQRLEKIIREEYKSKEK